MPCLMVLLVLASCKNRDRWLNRKWHSLNGHYNAYFNAREQLKSSLDRLANAHEDDYQQVLRVFPYGDKKAGKSEAENLEVVVNKATKVIQKHRVGDWVDDSYLLIGKAYMLKREHFLALETFQYINSNYKKTKIAAEGLVWMARNYILMERYGDAKAVMTLIRTKDLLDEKLTVPYYLTEAELAIVEENYGLALGALRKAIPKVSDRDKRLRYMFIRAQLLRRTGQNTSASTLFREVISKKPPYELAFQAKLNLARAYQGGKPEVYRDLKRFLIKMLEDEKNKQYLDQIYYELALLELKENKRASALRYFNQSLRAGGQNKEQKALTFLKLGELNLEDARYEPAKLYYDSAAMFMSEQMPGYAQADAKQEVLGRLIDNLVTIQREDSLLRLSRMDRKALNVTIDSAIARKKRLQARKKARAQEQDRQQSEAESNGGGLDNLQQRLNQRQQGGQAQPGSGDAWYFYNTAAKGAGYNEFIRKWGDRPLQDNWRTEETRVKQDVQSRADTAQGQDTASAQAQEAPRERLSPELMAMMDTISEDRAPYFRDIPFTEAQKEAAQRSLASAYARLGGLYAEEIGNFDEAIDAYLQINGRFRDTRYYVQSLYYLHKLKRQQGDSTEAAAYKDTLMGQFPSSDYALLLDDPEKLRARSRLREFNPRLERIYKAAYNAYQAGACDSLDQLATAADTAVTYNYYEGQLAYFSILCRHRQDTAFDTLISQLTRLKEDYEEEPVAAHIDNTIRYLREQSEAGPTEEEVKEIYDTEFVPEPQFYLMTFNLKVANQNRVVNAFSNLNQRKKMQKRLNISTQMLNRDTAAIVIRGFEGVDKALKYYQAVKDSRRFQEQAQLRQYDHFVISRTNFILLRKEQALAEYVSFFRRYYLNESTSSMNE